MVVFGVFAFTRVAYVPLLRSRSERHLYFRFPAVRAAGGVAVGGGWVAELGMASLRMGVGLCNGKVVVVIEIGIH